MKTMKFVKDVTSNGLDLALESVCLLNKNSNYDDDYTLHQVSNKLLEANTSFLFCINDKNYSDFYDKLNNLVDFVNNYDVLADVYMINKDYATNMQNILVNLNKLVNMVNSKYYAGIQSVDQNYIDLIAVA